MVVDSNVPSYLSLLLPLHFNRLRSAAADDPNYISINCGVATPATALSGRPWVGDAAALKLKGSPTVKAQLITAVDPVPYSLPVFLHFSPSSRSEIHPPSLQSPPLLRF